MQYTDLFYNANFTKFNDRFNDHFPQLARTIYITEYPESLGMHDLAFHYLNGFLLLEGDFFSNSGNNFSLILV